MPKPLWNGVLSFGLVNIPVRLYPAVHERDVRFHLLTPDGRCRLRQRLVCPETGKEYDLARAARGYEVAPDQYVILDEEELDRLAPEPGRDIRLADFIDLREIDPVYFDRSYYLAPGERADRPYRLLLAAMLRSGKVGIGRFVFRHKQYLAAVRPTHDALMLETMHYHDEVLPATDVPGLPVADTRPDERELAAAQRLIETLTVPFDPAAYRDDYRQRLQAAIEAKAEGEVFEEPIPTPEDEGDALTLIHALEESLAQAKRAAGRRRTA